MKKLSTLTLILLLASSVSFFSSCGTKGDPGPQGDPGNANVLATSFTVSFLDYTNEGGGFYDVVKNMSVLTADIIDNGFVQGFVGDAVQGVWTALPTADSFTYGGTYSYDYSIGQVKLNYQADTNGPSTEDFKIVAVAGSVRKMMEQNKVNIRDYNAVHNFLVSKNLAH